MNILFLYEHVTPPRRVRGKDVDRFFYEHVFYEHATRPSGFFGLTDSNDFYGHIFYEHVTPPSVMQIRN